MGFGVLFALLFILLAVAPSHPAHAGAITGWKWSSIGPEPDCCFFGGGETGRTTAVAVNPTNGDDIWIGTAGGGVWHSTDGGGHWAPMSDDQASLAIGSLALAGCSVSGCSTVYAGTGENAIRRDTYYGAGLLVGTVASKIAWTLHNGGPTFDFTHGSIYNVVLDRTTSGGTQVLYIALSSGVTASASESTVTAPPPLGGYGIYKSTDNAATWTRLTIPGTAASDRPTDLEIDRTDHNVLYAGFLSLGIFKSLDGGATWCPLNPGIPRPLGCSATAGFGLPNPHAPTLAGFEDFDHVEIDIYRGDHNHLYATFGQCPDRLVQDCAPLVFESVNAGLTWSERFLGSQKPTKCDAGRCSGGPNAGDICTAANQATDCPAGTCACDIDCPRGYSRYMHGLTISPTDPNTIYVTGFHLCESDNNGKDFFKIDSNTAGIINVGFDLHPDHHAIVFDETDPTRAYEVNDGGVAVSTTTALTWTPKTTGLDAMEFQSLAVSPDTTNVIGGTQDNSIMMWTGFKQWKNLRSTTFGDPTGVCCGDVGFTVMETYNNGLYNVFEMYATTNVGALGTMMMIPIRSQDGGTTWPAPAVPPAYDVGLNLTEPRSFYPPMVNVDGVDWFATDRLWSSVNAMGNLTPRSPDLSPDPEPEIWSGVDVISAIGASPTDPNRVYVGYYSGKVFMTSAAFTSPPPWNEADCGLPRNAPITWIAVDPSDENTAYATVSGFAPINHVYKTTNGGVTWSLTLGSLTELNGGPANTIAIDPNSPGHLYLGTDKGIYKSDNGGNVWSPFSNGLPNVPVYAITIDGSRGLVFAATHGRGAYLLSSVPVGRTYVDGPIRVGPEIRYNVPVFAGDYLPNQSCLVKVQKQDGSICASGRIDALGGTIHTDAEGVLVSSKAGSFTDLPVVWACAQGNCLGTDVRNCLGAGGMAGAVEVTCGGGTTVVKDPGPTGRPNPPSALFTLGGPTAGSLGAGGTFTLLPAIQTGDGSSQILCSVNVPFAGPDAQGAVLQRAADMLNVDPACMAAGVSAVVQDPIIGGVVEDIFARPGHLSLTAPDMTGGMLIPAVRAVPGQATGTCFTAGELDDPLHGRLRGMKLQFSTGAGGTTGGQLSLSEMSPLGQCSITVPTPAGASASAVASALAGAFQAPGIDPPPQAGCPSANNPRDVVAQGDSVRTALPSDIVVCVSDPGLGVSILPAEICSTNADCDDGNPCTADTCNPTTGLCHSTPLPDGTSCDDNNACTAGNTCQGGSCGTPVSCNDGNPCTTDVCNPATGACSSTPLACDDGNPCTIDSCSAATGGCVFTPAPAGSSCNDGDLCTTGDTCIQIPGNPTPICQGTAKCDDGNACTGETCDPATGACINTPIVCDDANPCTADACIGGTCVATPLPAGSVCDDTDLCTTGGTCQVNPFTGQAACSSQPVNCDDGDACTMDTCEPTTGGCTHAPIATAEVPNGFQFTSASSMNWPGVSGASFYNAYRGTIPQHMMGSRPPAGPLYDQVCFEYGDAHGDGATISTDGSSPPVGTGYYYLVSEETGCGESSIGSDSNTTPIPNSNPCSNPAPPALQIVKSHSGNFTQGQTGANYFIVVSNIGPGPSFGTVTVTELAPSGLTLVSMAGPGWSCPASPGDTCTRSDSLGPGLAYPPITVTVNVASNAPSPQVNKADVSGGGAPTATSSDSTTIIPVAPALAITKTHSGNFHRGQTGAVYTVTVSNTGNGPTSGTVTVTDNAPVGLTNVAMSGTGWTCPTPGATCTRSDALAPGASYPDLTVTVDVAPDAPVPTLTNQATASGGGSPAVTANDPTTIDYPLLAILKSHVGNFVQGQQGAVYTLRVQNQGFGPTFGTVTATEVTPSGLTLVSMSGTGWTCPASPGNTCTRSDSLASTAYYPDITVTVNVASNAPSSIMNEADITGGGSNGTGKGFDPTTIDAARIVLGITKSHTGNFVQGQPSVPYTVTVRNIGNTPTSGTVTVTENAPAGLTLLSMAGTGWTCPSPGNTCTRSDALAPGSNYPDVTVTVSVATNAPSSVTNQATVTGGGDGTLHTASDPTTINPGPPVLSLTKTHNGSFSQGQTNAKYTVTITNVATQTTAGPVIMHEMPPPGLTVVSMSGTGWSCDTVQCNRADPLPGGASYPPITVTVNVAATATSPQVNQVHVDGGGAPPVDASDSTTIVPAGVPNLSITKTHTGNFAHGQTNATYTLTVSNAVGAGTTSGTVTVTDTLPPGLVLASVTPGIGWSCAGLTCTRSAGTIPPGASATSITVRVNVLATASSPQVNQADVSGGGSAPSSTTDPTIISP
jgi:uncharacterized repeat protein (TIGR01451 family)